MRTIIVLVLSILISGCEKDKYTYPKPERYVKKHSTSRSSTLESTTYSEGYKKGQKLFKLSCAACHSKKLSQSATGPALIHITKVRDKEWLKSWTRNSQALIASGDPIAECLWDQHKPTIMTSYPELSNDDLDNIFTFIDEESEKIDPQGKSLSQCK